MTQVTRRAFVIGAVGLVATSCTSGDDDEPAPTPSSTSKSPSPTPSPTPTPPPVWPLTGLDASTADTARPVLAVKIDNTSGAQPQVGLAAADIVAEELVEGGVTRLVAMYHSGLPDVAGPVRSIRTSDIGLVKPTRGALVASGGAGRVLRRMDDAGIPVLAEGSPGFSRASDRSAPYNVMIDPMTVRNEAASDVPPPDQNYFTWGTDIPAGEPATQATAQFSTAHTTQWAYDGKAWRRTNGLAADGAEFAATTLLMLRVTTRDAGYEDPAGNFVPETVLTDGGDAVLLTDGVALRGTWSKGDAAEPFTFQAANGRPLTVPPGRTWIELVPESGSVSYSR